ncbi:hypothetical protein LTR08_007773 [Meristemomyces frigidus]|nr:hypothetical protein LTR08_007773 [Meristemomyces frigidus]
MTAPNASAACPPPFVDQSAHPYTGGFRDGRFCGNISSELSCCLPCPLEKWVYSNAFEHNVNVAYWLNIPALLCQVALLASFVVLPGERGHGQYLSVGLCVSLILFEMAFIIPLGTKPEFCHDAVTPNDMHSDASCAWSGVLLEAGAMAGTVWILLRSLWIHLRVCYDVRHTPAFVWISHAIGWSISALFLAISLPITGVSYRLGSTCLPNQQNAFATWFGWLIAFGCLAALFQAGTTGYCIWLYARHFWQSERSGGSVDMTKAGLSGEGQRRPSVRLGKGMAWRRVKKVMMLQWRSILLSILVIVETVYFGEVYVAASAAVEADKQSRKSVQVSEWSTCLVLSGGKKDACLKYAKMLGLGEEFVVASLFMSALIGIFTFALMVRWSMVTGWLDLIRHPRRPWKQCGSNLDMATPRRTSLGRSLRLDKSGIRHDAESSPFAATGILPEPSESVRQMSVPEAGEVATRHETTNWFDDEVYEEEEEKGRMRRIDE